jgi:AI-2 transport protein TqsA
MTAERSTDAEASAPDPAVSTEHRPVPTGERIVGAEPPDDGGAPDVPRSTLPRLFAIGVGGAGLAYCVMFLQGLGSVVAPVFLALNLMVTAHPLHSALARRGVNRSVAAIATGLLVLTVLGAFFTAIGWAITQLVTTLPEYNTQFQGLLTSITDQLAKIGVTPDSLLKQIQQISPSSALGVITPVFANLSTGAALLTVMVGVVFFLTMDSVSIDYRLDLAQRYHPRIIGGLRSFSQGVRRYWIVSSVFGLISAVLDVIALMIIGVPLALVWGVLAFLCNYIPNVGFFIGLVPPALLALLALGPGPALIVVAVYLGLNFVVQSLIMPRFTGQAVGITATLTFVSLLFWAWVLGVLGALLAVPATLFFKAVLIDADPNARWANALIAADPLTYEGAADAKP